MRFSPDEKILARSGRRLMRHFAPLINTPVQRAAGRLVGRATASAAWPRSASAR
jgi:hypothetical protein